MISDNNSASDAYTQVTMNVTATTKGPDANTKTIINGISHSFTLSGYDSLYYGSVILSHHTTATIHITVNSDYSLTYSPDILQVGDSVLHLRSADAVNKILTFQTYHVAYFQNGTFTTLQYNYGNHSYSFSQNKFPNSTDSLALLVIK